MADGGQVGRERVTVITLARRAGVAASTVSRALKGDPRISLETRRRVEALAMEAGYMPSAMARTLSGGRSGLVGLVLGANDNPFYAELMHEAVNQAAERGLRLLLLHAGAGPVEDRTAEALLHYQVDGCIITSAELSSRAAVICADHKVPVIMVNRVPRLHASAVACDNFRRRADARLPVAGGRPSPICHRQGQRLHLHLAGAGAWVCRMRRSRRRRCRAAGERAVILHGGLRRRAHVRRNAGRPASRCDFCRGRHHGHGRAWMPCGSPGCMRPTISRS